MRQRRLDIEVTSDRLGDHYAKYYDQLNGSERQMLSDARNVLERIAEAIHEDAEVEGK